VGGFGRCGRGPIMALRISRTRKRKKTGEGGRDDPTIIPGQARGVNGVGKKQGWTRALLEVETAWLGWDST